ncbi:conserved hypothetical protein [Ricinus communis]|uniref:DUF7356 domain-containing protein n=2 Tax=Ricinus communis TaxID=3988 RepID=B9SRS8_RICCO|nr:conserved hypothetical protein [Ricinus communis]
MDRNGMVTVILLLFLIVAADVSSASVLSTFRRFLTVATTTPLDSNQVSPSPSPDPIQTRGSKTTSNETTTGSKVNSKELNSNTDTTRPPPMLVNEGNNIKNENKTTDSQLEIGQNCSGMLRFCRDDASLVACILNSDPEYKKFVILVQNEGESNLKVDISAPNPDESTSFAMTKHQTSKINLSVGDSNQVIFKAGNGECVLHTDIPVSQGNIFFNLPSYDRLITPINGAYFLIVTVLIFGGMSICCLFRKKRQQDGIPYQELEMGLPESSLANNVETAEGWDQGWDDDWDEENAVKSPAAGHTGSISSNGLTSRSPTSKRDGWENDWDD